MLAEESEQKKNVKIIGPPSIRNILSNSDKTGSLCTVERTLFFFICIQTLYKKIIYQFSNRVPRSVSACFHDRQFFFLIS